jgi:hypothetical protein
LTKRRTNKNFNLSKKGSTSTKNDNESLNESTTRQGGPPISNQIGDESIETAFLQLNSVDTLTINRMNSTDHNSHRPTNLDFSMDVNTSSIQMNQGGSSSNTLSNTSFLNTSRRMNTFKSKSRLLGRMSGLSPRISNALQINRNSSLSTDKSNTSSFKKQISNITEVESEIENLTM